MFTKDNPLNIIFVGRLDEEKWTKVLLDCIKKTMIHITFETTIRWHIVGIGDDLKSLQKIADKFPERVTIYGKKERAFIDTLMKDMHLSIAPSVFLETFWLVALESLSAWVPVCGFKKWGLIPFVPDYLALDENNSGDSFLKILERIFESWFEKNPDLSLYDKNLWREELKIVVSDKKTVLIVHDYLAPIGGAEVYVSLLREELEGLWKIAKFVWYRWALPRWKRILFGILTPFSFWHKKWMQTLIRDAKPDVIWMHGIGRYIWPWWLKAIVQSQVPTIITHHDLWLITARPSKITNEAQIPQWLNYQDFVKNISSPIEYLLRAWKFYVLRAFWKYLVDVPLHLVPSEFMKPHFERFWAKQVEVFPHSITR